MSEDTSKDRFVSDLDQDGYIIDPADIYRRYDEAVVALLDIHNPSHVGKKFYTLDELNLLDVQDLRKIALSFDVNDKTDRKDLLIKAIINAQRIPVVFARGEPAYSTQELATGRKEGTPVFTIRYPICSVRRLGVPANMDRFNRSPRRKLVWSNDGNAVLQGWQPNPVYYSYQVDFVGTKQSHMNMIDIHVNRLWSFPHVRFEVDLGKPWGRRGAYALIEGPVIDREYESSAEQAELRIRHTYTMNVEGWLPTQHWMMPTVRKLTRDYKEYGDDGDELLNITETLPDIYGEDI